MKLGTVMMKLEEMSQKVHVYDDLIEYLGRDDLEIPVEGGDASREAIEGVRDELVAARDRLVECLGAAEDVEVGDVELEALGED